MYRLVLAGVALSGVVPVAGLRAQQPATIINAAAGPAWVGVESGNSGGVLSAQLGASRAVSRWFRVGIHTLGWAGQDQRFISVAPTVGIAIIPRVDFTAGLGLGYRRSLILCSDPMPGCEGYRTRGNLTGQVGISRTLRSIGSFHPRLDITYHASLRKLDSGVFGSHDFSVLSLGVGIEWAR